MKKEYIIPEIEIILIEDDIITSSTMNDGFVGVTDIDDFLMD